MSELHRQTKESLESWRASLLNDVRHRNGTTAQVIEYMAINEIFDLAQRQLKIEKRIGRKAKALALEMLRSMVNEYELMEESK